MKTGSNPKKRTTDLIVEEVLDEVVIYDLADAHAHALNPTAAYVWQQCDGTHTPADISRQVEAKFNLDQADDLVALSLDKLAKAKLLDVSIAAEPNLLSRRDVVKKIGVGIALLPVVTSIVAPSVAQAASHCPPTCDQSIDVTAQDCLGTSSSFMICITGSEFCESRPYTIEGFPCDNSAPVDLGTGDGTGMYDLSGPGGCQTITVMHPANTYKKVRLTALQSECGPHNGSEEVNDECEYESDCP